MIKSAGMVIFNNNPINFKALLIRGTHELI